MRVFVFAALAALLAACATQTPYQPASAHAAYGFEEQRIEGNRIRITFRGNSLTDRETVETYLLYRAAELTIQGGRDYFIVANRDTEEHSRLVGAGAPRFGFDYWYFSPRHGWRPWYDPFWDQPMDYRKVTRYEAIAEIAMFVGSKPQNDANAFDAREVMRNLEGQIVRPPAAG